MIFDEKKDLIKQIFVHARRYNAILYDYKSKGISQFTKDDVSLIDEIRIEMSDEVRQLDLKRNMERYSNDKRYIEYYFWLLETVSNVSGRTNANVAFDYVYEFYLNMPNEYAKDLRK